MSGRPRGRPNGNRGKNRGGKIPADLRSLARCYTDESIRIIAAIMRCESTPAQTRLNAAQMMLDRGWGRANEHHHVDVNDGQSLLRVVNEIVHVHETREQIEFRDQTPLLELEPTDDDASQSTH